MNLHWEARGSFLLARALKHAKLLGMRAKVTSKGVLIPKEWFGSATEVEIIAEQDRVLIIRVDDPIFALGTSPVKTGVNDASEDLNKYLYQ